MEANPEKEQFYRTTPNLKNGFVKMAQSRLGSTLATTFLPDIHRSFNVDDKGPDRFLQSAVTHRQAAYSSFLRSSSSFRNAKWKLDTLHQTLTATES